MNVFLDGERVPGSHVDLASAMNASRSIAEARGRILIEVKGDGKAIPDAILESPDAAVGKAYGEIHFQTAEPRQLVRNTVLGAVDLLEDIRAGQAAAAESFQTGETGQAFEHLQTVLTNWQVVQSVVASGTQLLSMSLTDPATGGGTSFDVLGNALSKELTAVRNSLAAQDHAAVADSLAYDLTKHVDSWSVALKAMASKIETMPVWKATKAS
jgi:hypothetical protein